MLVDPGGDFLYFDFDGGYIAAYQIDQDTGTLSPAPGSPYTVPMGANSMALDPNGHFLYVTGIGDRSGSPLTITSYSMDRSSGALTISASTDVTAFGDLVTNYTGAYLYLSTLTSNNVQQIFGYRVNSSGGALTVVPGSPYTIPGTFVAGSNWLPPVTAWKYLYQAQSTGNGLQQVWGLEIGSDGALTTVVGSPFSESGAIMNTPLTADWLTHDLWFTGPTGTGDTGAIYTNTINESSGSLSPNSALSTTNYAYESLVEDHSGTHLYGGGAEATTACIAYGGPYCPDAFGSWKIGDTGELTQDSELALTFNSLVGIVAVATSR